MATFTWNILADDSPSSPPATSPPSVSSEPGNLQLFGGFDQEIDPVVGDYIDTADGGWAETQTSRTAVVCQLSIRYNSWPADPDAGSRLTEWLESGEPITPEMVIDDTRRSMQLVVEDGLISDLEVEIGEDDFDPEAGRLDVQINYTDVMSGHAVELVYSPF